jgi:hypothetical protein
MSTVHDHIEALYAGQYEIEHTEIQNAERLGLRHLDQIVTIDLFDSRKIVVGGTNCPLKDEIKAHVDAFRKDPTYFKKLPQATASAVVATPEQAILQHINNELLGFLPEHDRLALIASYQILLSGLELVDYSPAIMPVGRVYEGFLGELLVGLGMVTKTTLQDPKYNLMFAFDSADAKTLKSKIPTHEAKLESAKQRLKEFRHIQLHSQSSQFVQCKTRAEAFRFVERVLGDMQALFDYFKKYFV